MHCPICRSLTKVTNSRLTEEGRAIKRRRECLKCQRRFSTYERISLVDLRVQKRQGTTQPYHRQKLEVGLKKALEKRPVTEEQFQKMIFMIEDDILNLRKELVASEQIGRIVLEHLKQLDKVAYLRFASIYRDFRSTKAFEKEIQKLEKD